VTLSGNLLPVPAHVPRGLLTVWNWEVDRNVGTTWNFTNSDLSPSLRVLRVPDLSSENALSVGAKMVIPVLESLSAENKWFSSWVDLKRRIKIVKWPAFSRILVTLVMPCGAAACVGVATGGCATTTAGACAGAAVGDWAKVLI